MNTIDTKIILASKSPRRKYLLTQAGLEFTIKVSSIDESIVSMDDPRQGVEKLARLKAGDIAETHPDNWVIGADTVVVIGSAVLGKPKSKDQAVEMLKSLSGNTHQVYTGYAVMNKSAQKTYSGTAVTDVKFKDLTAEEIEWYSRTKEPFDKAGSYAIQGLGTFLVERINGSYTNVVGLPVCEVISILIEHKIVGLGDLNNNGE